MKHWALWGMLVLASLVPSRSWSQALTLKCVAGIHMAQTGWPNIRFPYQVLIADANDVLVTNYTGFVTVSTLSSPSGGTIAGTVTVQATSTNLGAGQGIVSVATFRNIILTGSGDWRLTFTAAGLTPCTTQTFAVRPSLHLGSTSPARGFGLSLPGVVTTDLDGCPVAQSGAIDAGALQDNRAVGTGCVADVLPAPQNFRFGP